MSVPDEYGFSLEKETWPFQITFCNKYKPTNLVT